MSRVLLNIAPRTMVVLALAASLFYLQAVPAMAAGHQTSSNDSNIEQADWSERGEEYSEDGGVAVSGPAISDSIAVAPQVNVQVIAGPEGSHENSSQSADNHSDIDQAAGSNSGDSEASDRGVAVSGPAIGLNVAVHTQYNVQVIAGPGDDVHQYATNDANTGQGAEGSTGETAAEDWGVANSGPAVAANVSTTNQGNVQVYPGY